MEQKLVNDPTYLMNWIDNLPTERREEVLNALQVINKCLAILEERYTARIERLDAIANKLENMLDHTDKKIATLREDEQVLASRILNPTATKKPS